MWNRSVAVEYEMVPFAIQFLALIFILWKISITDYLIFCFNLSIKDIIALLQDYFLVYSKSHDNKMTQH